MFIATVESVFNSGILGCTVSYFWFFIHGFVLVHSDVYALTFSSAFFNNINNKLRMQLSVLTARLMLFITFKSQCQIHYRLLYISCVIIHTENCSSTADPRWCRHTHTQTHTRSIYSIFFRVIVAIALLQSNPCQYNISERDCAHVKIVMTRQEDTIFFFLILKQLITMCVRFLLLLLLSVDSYLVHEKMSRRCDGILRQFVWALNDYYWFQY